VEQHPRKDHTALKESDPGGEQGRNRHRGTAAELTLAPSCGQRHNGKPGQRARSVDTPGPGAAGLPGLLGGTVGRGKPQLGEAMLPERLRGV